MARKYELKRRAEQQEETRQRIVEATVEMHETLGIARTTISAIAERAGVQRLTVYRHFPDERTLFTACTSHYQAKNPPPDPAPWARIADPEVRLRSALTEVYAYHSRTEPMMLSTMHDIPQKPVMFEILQPFFQHWERMRDVLAVGWGARGERRELLLAAIGHALDFGTWRSLVREQGLDDEQATDLMARMVRCAMRD